ncbi:unnamed protein product [Rotaria sp. Silwood1]|nr:unnamed protein product [Rotaria sp. Silwood1]CAF4871292.1 unnamed protein product [Rotaria sp. Silwood1]
MFSGDNEPRDNYASIIFELHIQKPLNYTGKPFIDISDDGNLMSNEEEVLFSAGSLWSIEDVRRVEHLWYVQLRNCTDRDTALDAVLARLTNGYTLMSIGDLLRELGENDKAEDFYRHIAEDESNIPDDQKGFLNYHIGMLRAKKKDYNGALDSLNKAITYFPPPIGAYVRDSSLKLSITNASVANRTTLYLDIGKIYYRNKNRRKAEEAWKNAIAQGGAFDDLAKVYDWLACLANNHGEYEQAKEYRRKAMELINQCVGKEEMKCELKRKWDDAIQLCAQMDDRLKPKRQRTTSGSKVPT